MTKNNKISFILYLSFFALIIAYKSISVFFSGVGLPFVLTIGVVSTLLMIFFHDKNAYARTKELFITICAFCALEFLIYFFVELDIAGYDAIQGFMVFQNILSFFAVLFFAYTMFRFICESKNVRFKFVEFLLGNRTKDSEPKKAKEISNGCLEDKPRNNVVDESIPTEEISADDISIEE